MRALVVVAAALAAAACTSSAETGRVPAPPSGGSAVTPTQAGAPRLVVEEVASGLTHGWDVGFLPDGKLLVSQRNAVLALVSGGSDGRVTTLKADLGSVAVGGEGGLMGLVVHPDFATSREFTTCQNHTENGQPADIRLVTWRLTEDETTATRVRELVTGLPTAASGRHSGCRPTIGPDGALLVGTGDTARGDVPQDLDSLGGKVLRVDLKTGEPLPDNPRPGSRVYTHGHRNIQGVAVRPGTDQVFTAEHGPDKNDEINLLVAGGNYGWDPSQGGAVGGYDEDVPMTDLERFPDAVPAKWESGDTTEAICALTFLTGPQWGDLDGALVATALRGAKLMIFTLSEAGDITSVAIPDEFRDTFGRLRAARTAPDGALYVTTSNGENDKLLKITPA